MSWIIVNFITNGDEIFTVDDKIERRKSVFKRIIRLLPILGIGLNFFSTLRICSEFYKNVFFYLKLNLKLKLKFKFKIPEVAD